MPDTLPRILIVEDDDSEREALARVLRLERYQVIAARSPAEALELTVDRGADLVISDLCLRRESGIDLLRRWKSRYPQTPFLLVTAFGTIQTAVDAIKLGADDFLLKPVDPEALLEQVLRLLQRRRPIPLNANDSPSLAAIVGKSAAVTAIRQNILRAAASNSTVLIMGESGTGKELVARAIHASSPRASGPLVVINMAAVPETLVESELFGHSKGAFTSAVQPRVGRFEQANLGTLFIDEIGDFPLHMQPKLLRVVEDGLVSPLGSEQDVKVDVRLVAATSRPLAKLVRAGEFREDLYYRLNVIAIDLPPLRQRREDIAPLVNHFLQQFAANPALEVRGVSAELMQRLESLPWPGNVRQLRNCLERMCVMTSSAELSLADLPSEICEEETAASGDLRTLERSAILETLRRHDGNRTRTAEALGISVRTLQRRLRDWGDVEQQTE
ncbi:sigma-54-dependent transcriptional regulator [Anatilimnocola sp. NA78]|uniref:sigma-54-dependent transcriptional regulator n=1 Tax=Anatilimnocola sp. NA78 TaxID=3415683 RepID=UPI003CE49B4E